MSKMRSCTYPIERFYFFPWAPASHKHEALMRSTRAFINSNHAKELDCSATFLNNLDSLSRNLGPIRFELPFRNWSKADVVRRASELNVPIGRTYSCQLFTEPPW